MKYRGSEIQEICIGVEFDASLTTYRKVMDFLIKNLNVVCALECVDYNYILIRGLRYTNDDYGLNALKSIYDRIGNFNFETHLVPYVDIITEDWWIHENGNEYNNDSVSWEDFIGRLEI